MYQEDILYTAYFIECKERADKYPYYIDSIISMFNKFKNKPFLFITEAKIYGSIIDRIELWDTCYIHIIEFEKTNSYLKYYNMYNEYSLLEHNNFVLKQSYNSPMNLIIWHYKFELLTIAKEYCKKYDKTYICYLDSGLFRDNRIKYIKEFMEHDFKVNGRNSIMINYTKYHMELNIDINRLLTYGDYEITTGNLFFHIEYIDELYSKYFETLEDLLQKQIITTEQRVLALVLRKKYNSDPELFTFKRNNQGDSYIINLHN